MVKEPAVPAVATPCALFGPVKPPAPVKVSLSLRLTDTLPLTAPPENVSAFRPPALLKADVLKENDWLCHEESWRAWVTVACIDWMMLVIDVRPLLEA